MTSDPHPAAQRPETSPDLTSDGKQPETSLEPTAAAQRADKSLELASAGRQAQVSLELTSTAQRTDTSLELTSAGPEHTLAIGRALGESLYEGALLALAGALGAGKTQLTKGIAVGLGVAADEPVVSPTFVLVREYQGRIKLFHLDAYRLSGPDELLSLGFEEMCAAAAVVVVEWADRVSAAIGPAAIWIDLEHAGPAARRLVIRASPEALARFRQRLAQTAGGSFSD